MKKICFKCDELKPLSEFYKHKEMKDGHVNKCKECNKKDVQKNYKKNIKYYKKYDQERSNLPHRVKARKDYSKTDRGLLVGNKAKKKHHQKYKNAYTSRSAFSNSLRDGLISKKTNCEKCNSNRIVQGHHKDYNYPLDVDWLCIICHNEWHKNNTPKNRKFGIFNKKQGDKQ